MLELPTSATGEEIRNAYYVMVKVWHPDRFQGDEQLRQTAEAKIKEINAAFLFLTSRSSASGPQAHSSSTTAEPPDSTPWADQQNPYAGDAPVHVPRRYSPSPVLPAVMIVFRIVLVGMALLAFRYLWIAFEVRAATSDAATQVFGFGKDTVDNQFEAPKRRFLEAVQQDMRRLGFQGSPPSSAVASPSEQPSPAASQRPPRAGSSSKPLRVYAYLTVGSTRDEVLDELGEPTSSASGKLVYGQSELDFKDDRVVGWRIDPVSSPIPVKLWPSASVDPTLDSFTVGSPKNVVLVVQGTPTAFSEEKFEYAGSEVYFQNQRVVRWKNDPATIPLRARLP